MLKIMSAKTVALPPCEGVITNRNILTRLPEKEGTDLYVGDIIWSKVPGYPWWPCMITVDPQTGKYSRSAGSIEKPERLYHVQYFGSKALRSYTSIGSVMAFEGRAKYELELDRIKNTPGTQKASRKAALNRLVVKPNFKKEWKFACDEAEEALKLDRENRIKELTFDYIVVKDVKTLSRKEEAKTPKSAKKNKKPENPLNVYDFSDGDEDFDEGTSPTLCLWSAKRANRKGDFDVYVSQTRSKLVDENPDASESEIDRMLKTRWSHMSEDLKAKYCVRETNGKDVKTPSKKSEKEKSPRGKKRKSGGKEKLEAQANGDLSMTEKNGDVSENESALVIADMTTPKKSRKSKEPNGSGKRSIKPLKIILSSKSPKETKLIKTPKSTKSARTPKDETPIKSEEITKSTPGRSKPKAEPKESSPRKRPSSTPINSGALEKPKRSRKSTSKENGPEEKEKTPKKQEKVDANEVTKSKEKNKEKDKEKEQEKEEEKEKDKEKISAKRKSVVQQIDNIESEETRTSEDASSLSETETVANKEGADRLCEKCCDEALEDYIQCSGLCLRFYHKKCLPKNFNSETLQCQECASGQHQCFICHSHSPDVKKCSESKCGKFYHVKCLQNNYPHKMIKDENSEGFVCPLHFCITCYVEHQDDQVHSYLKKRILKCLKCPTAYHFTDACLSAGSVSISFSYIICPEHTPPKFQKHVNVNWCFSCNTGGSLICCERCPAAFHQSCLETPLPEGNFFCGDCLVHKQLHYNDIVWVKLGSYRWWPGRVCHPKNVPDNVMKLAHSIGEFPVYFFGSHDYFWIHRGKAFPFVEGDLTKAPALAKGAKRDFRDAISEAIEAFTLWQETKRNTTNLKIKPPPYIYLRVNKRVGKAPKASPKEDDDAEPIVCSCKADADSPCGIDEDCFNRLTLIECDPSRCNTGDKCQNRRFRKREYAKVQPFKTQTRGWGLRALQDIKKGSFVIEYVGELIDEGECEARIESMIEKHESNFYFLTIDRDTIIDAGPKGNLARFMNHSCSPNCETQKWVVGGLTRVGLFAIQDIPKGSELTFNYNLHCRGNEKTACNCGAKNCSGFLGVRPNKIADEESGKKQNKPEKSKTKPNPKNIGKKEFESFHEDECFKCGEGGELVMCDRRKCPKSYHLACLKLTKLPRGLWFCPWHHCDECGKLSSSFCEMCPTSFCGEHGTNLLSKNDKGLQICYEHLSPEENLSRGITTTASMPPKEIKEPIKENGETSHNKEAAATNEAKEKPDLVAKESKVEPAIDEIDELDSKVEDENQEKEVKKENKELVIPKENSSDQPLVNDEADTEKNEQPDQQDKQATNKEEEESQSEIEKESHEEAKKEENEKGNNHDENTKEDAKEEKQTAPEVEIKNEITEENDAGKEINASSDDEDYFENAIDDESVLKVDEKGDSLVKEDREGVKIENDLKEEEEKPEEESSPLEEKKPIESGEKVAMVQSEEQKPPKEEKNATDL